MQKLIYSLLLSFLTITSFGQKKEVPTNFNFDCETIENGKPMGWIAFKNPKFITKLDSTVSKSGKYSLFIQCDTNTDNYCAWSFVIPNNYSGEMITLTGFVKTEDVQGEGAAIWMAINPEVAYDHMNRRKIKGTTDWTQYQITLPMNPSKTKIFSFGGMLSGKGKMWLDDFQITIDGKNIKKLKPIAPVEFLADKDTAFSNGSQISEITLDNTKIENLKHLGLIWGFLKYYHPNIAKGNFNWDYELFRILPKVLSASTNTERDAIFATWIQKLGEFEVGKEKSMKSNEVKLYPDLDWIQNSNYSPELTTLLTKVKNAKRSNFNYYVRLSQGKGNAILDNENGYRSMIYPDAGFRVLSLFRYWNIIQYYFPYRNLIGEDWKPVLTEFIPKFVNASNETEYTLTALELMSKIHDSHAGIIGSNLAYDNYLGNRSTALKVNFVEGKAVVVGYYDTLLGKETGLKIGDVIFSINNKSIDVVIRENLKISSASNYPTQLREIAQMLLRSNDSVINIGYIHDGVSSNSKIKTYELEKIYRNKKENDTCFKWITKDIAYIHNGFLKREYLPKLFSEIRSAKGLIIDDRNYPSDFPIEALSRYLLPKKTAFAKFSGGCIKDPGLFSCFLTEQMGTKNRDYFKGKVVIMVNEVTQSSAEFHAMAYRTAPNSLVIGSTTAGADGNISEFQLPGGINTWITGLGMYYPDGRETQRVGIVPDVEVKPTIEGIKNGRDEVLEKAIEIINGK